MFCSNCGSQIPDGSNFCANCGAQLTAAVVPTIVNATVGGDNSVMLLSLGACSAYNAAGLLQQLCGYSAEDAQTMVASVPIAIARGLTDAQANTLAQALCEYGLDISIYDSNGWRELSSASASVWDKAGSLIAGAASALGLIGVANRITRGMMHRMDYPYRFTGARPPVYRLHSTLRQVPPPPRPARPVAPKPAPRKVVEPRRPAPRAAGAQHPGGMARPSAAPRQGGASRPGNGPRGGHPSGSNPKKGGGHGGPGMQPR